jgi:hypothetical protein
VENAEKSMKKCVESGLVSYFNIEKLKHLPIGFVILASKEWLIYERMRLGIGELGKEGENHPWDVHPLMGEIN